MIVSPWCTRRAAAPLTFIVARAALAGDRVGLEAGAVVDVDDVRPARARGCRRPRAGRGRSVIDPT